MRTKNHQNHRDLSDVCETLMKADIFCQGDYDTIKNHQNPAMLYNALQALSRKNILTRDNFEAIKNHPAPLLLVTALRVLNRAKILTQDNRDKIKNHSATTTKALADALWVMHHEKRILDQEYFDLLIISMQIISMQEAPTIQQQRDWTAFREDLEKIEHPFAWFLLGKLSCSECWYIYNEGNKCTIIEPSDPNLSDPNKALDYFNKIPIGTLWYEHAQKSISNIHQTNEDCKSANAEVEESKNPQRQATTKRGNEEMQDLEDPRGGKRQRRPSAVNKRIASQAVLPQHETADTRPRFFNANCPQTLFSRSFHQHNAAPQGGRERCASRGNPGLAMRHR